MARQSNSIIAYTIVIPELKEYLDQTCKGRGIMAVDLLNPLMDAFMKRFNKEPNHQPKLMRQVR